MPIKRNYILKPILFVACLVPLILLVAKGFRAELGANPIERITHETGSTTLVLLLISLGITPLRRISGVNWLIQYRRMLGLFAFLYAFLHMLTYVWLDQFFNVAAMIKDVAKRPFITVGTLAFLLLVPLALTSTQGAIRRLGKRWQKLHRLVYISAALGVLHFVWLVKKDISEPLNYAGILAVLMGYRVVVRVLDKRKAKAQRAVSPVLAN